MKPNTYKLKDLIVYEDDDFLILNKPPHLAVMEDRKTDVNLLTIAKAVYDDIQVCHRLDKETSGIIAFAKNPEAHRHLSIQFEKRKVDKIYHCLVEGIHDLEPIKIDRPILTLSRGNVRIDPEGKPSQTVIRTGRIYRHHTLIECKPLTGRMHQIRIHMSHYGMPLVGDTLYGGKPIYLSEIKRKFNLKRGTEEEPLFKRVALHAWSLTFENLKGESITADAPYPKDFRAMINQLEKNA